MKEIHCTICSENNHYVPFCLQAFIKVKIVRKGTSHYMSSVSLVDKYKYYDLNYKKYISIVGIRTKSAIGIKYS